MWGYVYRGGGIVNVVKKNNIRKKGCVCGVVSGLRDNIVGKKRYSSRGERRKRKEFCYFKFILVYC